MQTCAGFVRCPVVSRASGEPDAQSLTPLGVVIEQLTQALVSTHSTDTSFCRLDQFVVELQRSVSCILTTIAGSGNSTEGAQFSRATMTW